MYNHETYRKERWKYFHQGNKMTRVYNFSAGPACLPEWVLAKAANEMLDAHNSGMSVMEMSHRSSEFQDIIPELFMKI